LLRRLSESRPESRWCADGRLPATRPRRSLPRQVSQQLLETGTVRAGQNDEGRVRSAARVSHLSARPSHHGAGAELLVPARGPQSPEILRHLPLPRRGFSKGDAAGLSLAASRLEYSRAGSGTREVSSRFRFGQLKLV